jgi:hypothetical protein
MRRNFSVHSRQRIDQVKCFRVGFFESHQLLRARSSDLRKRVGK